MFRLWRKYQHLAKRFLAKPTVLCAYDTFCIELLHARREGDAGLCSKWFVRLNSSGQIVRVGCCRTNCHDTIFGCVIEAFEDVLVLADTRLYKECGKSAPVSVQY